MTEGMLPIGAWDHWLDMQRRYRAGDPQGKLPWDSLPLNNEPILSDTKGRQRGRHVPPPARMPHPRRELLPFEPDMPQRLPRQPLRTMLPLDEQTHAELFLRRLEPDADHAILAPFEHRAFAREFAEEHPWRAAISMPFAIPAYTAAKALGLTNARSPASLDEIFAGYHGLTEGMLNAMVPSAYARARR